MSRQKYQRPKVYAAGTRERLWKAEYREYYIDANGKEASRHKSKTWSRDTHTKAQAQQALDKLLMELQAGPPKQDGSMTLAAFWEQIYYPIRSARWTANTRWTNNCIWKMIEPVLGGQKLSDIHKAAIELFLMRVAASGKSQNTTRQVYSTIHAVLEEAVVNEFIERNPARKLRMPAAAAPVETRSLTEAEVRRLWDTSEGGDYVFWRVLILTGMRISEALALTRADILPAGLLIDESSIGGRPVQTKNKRVRLAPLPESLRGELTEWLSTHECDLIFPTPDCRMMQRAGDYTQAIRDRARTAAGIPGLTFRMARTTFATLFEGDIKDAQAILGHHSPAFTLAIYRKPITERQQAAVESLDKRLYLIPGKKRA